MTLKRSSERRALSNPRLCIALDSARVTRFLESLTETQKRELDATLRMADGAGIRALETGLDAFDTDLGIWK